MVFKYIVENYLLFYFQIKIKVAVPKVDLSEDDKLIIVEHLTTNVSKYYGRLTGDLGLAQQKKYWEELASSYKECNVSCGYHLKEIVRNWIKRANEQFEKKHGHIGASGADLLSQFQTSCLRLQQQMRGDEFMNGIESVQSSDTNKILTSTPKTERQIKATSSSSSTTSQASTNISFPNESDSSSFDFDMKLPTPLKRNFESKKSVSVDDNDDKSSFSNKNLYQLMSRFCESQAKEHDLKYKQLEIEQKRLEFEREKWNIEKKLIEQSIEEKRYKGMYYYLKCQQLMKTPHLNSSDINSAHEIFQAPMYVEVNVQQEDERSFADSIVSSTDE